MKNAKKIIIGVVVVALVAGGAAGGAVYLKSNNKETVGVVSVDSLALIIIWTIPLWMEILLQM